MAGVVRYQYRSYALARRCARCGSGREWCFGEQCVDLLGDERIVHGVTRCGDAESDDADGRSHQRHDESDHGDPAERPVGVWRCC